MKITIYRLATTTIIVSLISYIFSRAISITTTIKPFVESVSVVLTNINATHDEKMGMKYPRYYEYIQWLKTELPPDSIIYQTDTVIPYGDDNWPSNHIQMNSAWLYPIQVLPWESVNTQSASDSRYVMIVDRFPAINIPATHYVIFSESGNPVTTYGDYNPEMILPKSLGYIAL